MFLKSDMSTLSSYQPWDVNWWILWLPIVNRNRVRFFFYKLKVENKHSSVLFKCKILHFMCLFLSCHYILFCYILYIIQFITVNVVRWYKEIANCTVLNEKYYIKLKWPIQYSPLMSPNPYWYSFQYLLKLTFPFFRFWKTWNVC